MSALRRPPPQCLRALRCLCVAAVWLLACGPAGDPGAAPPAPPAPAAPGSAQLSETSGVADLRVVALSPLASRFVVAIGARARLVGVDEASARLPELAGVGVVDLAGAARLEPDLVLAPVPPDPDDPVARTLRAMGAEWIEFAPHSLEDAFSLCRSAGAALVGTSAALRFENAIARPLAQIGGSSFGRPRPRVVAVVGLDPLELAGGHSFETDLIEIAGGSSLTHGGSEPRLAIERDALAKLGADLVLVASASEMTEAQQRAARAALPEGPRIAFFAYDRDFFWLRDPASDAARLRAVIEPLSRELEARRD